MKITVLYATVKDGSFVKRRREFFQALADQGTEVEVLALERGPTTIETLSDVAFASPGVLQIIRERQGQTDGFVVNCCSDPAVEAARELTDKVVLGTFEASLSVALHLGHRFAYIHPFTKSASQITLQARHMGIESRVGPIIPVNLSVAELSRNPDGTVNEIVRAAEKATENEGADVVILGCTGMADLARRVRERINVPLVEPASAGLKTAEMLIKLELHHQRRSGGMYPVASLQKVVGY